MSMLRKKYCVANWKMNFTQADIRSFITQWKNKKLTQPNVKTIFCSSFTDINTASLVMVQSNDTYAAACFFMTYASSTTTIISDPSDIYAAANQASKIGVYTDTNDGNINIKNRRGASRTVSCYVIATSGH